MAKGIEMTHCKDCPFKKAGNFWSSDGWDRMEDWMCTKMDNKIIFKGVEWHDEKKILIPNWCPLPELKDK